MSDFDTLMINYNALILERNQLAEFSDVATEKIDELQQELDSFTAYIETLEKALAQAQGTTCEQ